MGVINITPNSFSDKHDSKDSQISRLKELKDSSVSVIDIGAQSTAPFNKPISISEEKRRYKKFFSIEQIEAYFNPSIILSFDTYYPEVMRWLLEEYPFLLNYQIWWNDVSGILSHEVYELMEDYPKLHYVYCHNHVPDRMSVLDHMKYVKNTCDLAEKFEIAINSFVQHKIEDRLILDPCFGFAKSFEQNWYIIDNLETLYHPFRKYPLIFGVSKKSFMREKARLLGNLPKDHCKEDLFLRSEIIHQELINKLKQSMSSDVFFRVHNVK